MLTYQQALEKILRHTLPVKKRALPLRESLGCLLAQDLFSREPFPHFDNSAVDGYAIRRGADTLEFKVQGEVRAGEYFKGTLKPGRALRIFTGAPVPRRAQAVVMQEHTERRNGSIRLAKDPRWGENIRFRGEDFQKGRVLVRKGARLNPCHLALLAAAGFEKISVIPKPSAAILATGNELLKIGEKLQAGKIRDSNTILLEAQVKEAGGIPQALPFVGDRPALICDRIRKGLQSDLLLIAGGVSVGAYDFVKEALKKEGVRKIFWKVNIKPGKPLFFGRKGKTLVFGLPGNPVSVFVTFEEFIKPALRKMSSVNLLEDRWVSGFLTEKFENGPRLHFVRVHCRFDKNRCAVTPLGGQGSHMIGELASADALLRVEPEARLKKGETVRVKIINEDCFS